ncbi:leucine-rich repeat domain-containing protein [Actinomadura craniellae]|uniref:Leucine-rich repeat domain-containing protein n=1 Tax=Actinomadura craniellae TaxID=2231787 RepID=A0A365GVQ2_9ACTN|nr:STM4015 family protein [Actinomadura craniellae]RAY10880.1 leucine-rich repeat domain-containing protein [Actinomadura craniellae]
MNDLGACMTLPWRLFPPLGEEGPDDPAPSDAGTVAWRLHYNSLLYSVKEDGYDAYLARFMESVDTTRVRELVFGCCGEPSYTGPDEAVELLIKEAARFPALRAVAFGDISYEDAELSWTSLCDVTPLLRAFPALEVLEVRGGDDLALGPVRHESLQALRIETGGLPGEVVRTVGDCDLPALEHLELWLGVAEYGGDATVADLAPILSGERLPALRYLGLRNGEIQDEVAAAVAAAPVVARLETLSLGLGVLTDEGAEALLSGQPLTHLKKLDLHHHFIGEEMMQRLRAALPGVEVDLSGREEPDPGDEWWSPYVAAAE